MLQSCLHTINTSDALAAALAEGDVSTRSVMTTEHDIFAALRASADVRAAAAALLALAPAPVAATPETPDIRRARLALQRAVKAALPEAYLDGVGCGSGAWRLGLAVRVPRGTPGACGSYLRPTIDVAALIGEAL